MSWAELWAKGKENHARFVINRWRLRIFMLGAVFAMAGGGGLYSDTWHHIKGRAATATLMEHVKQCTVEYQRIGEEMRKENAPCDQAEEFQRRVGRNKVAVSRDLVARVQFRLEDGRTHDVNVDESRLGSYILAPGATLPVVYAPDNPDDVRAKISWEQVQVWLTVFAIGIVCLAVTLLGPLASLFGWASRRRTSRAWDETVSAPSRHLHRH